MDGSNARNPTYGLWPRSMELLQKMIESELKYRQAELLDRFRILQEFVDAFALDQLAEDQQSPRYIPEWRVSKGAEAAEDSAAFREFEALFQDYWKRCLIGKGIDATKYWLQIQEAIAVPDAAKEAESNGDEKTLSFSPLGTWLRASGFYWDKFFHGDRSDWSWRFSKLLDELPSHVGELFCATGVNGISGEIAFDNVSLGKLTDDRLKAVQDFWYLVGFGGADDNSYEFVFCDFRDEDILGLGVAKRSEDFNKLVSCWMVKSIIYEPDLHWQYWERDPFEVEKTALQVMSRQKLSFGKSAVFSRCFTEPVFHTKIGSCEATLREYSLGAAGLLVRNLRAKVSGDKLEIALTEKRIEEFHGHWRVGSTQFRWGLPLTKILTKHIEDCTISKLGLWNSLRLYAIACEQRNLTLSFLMLITCLESVLLCNKDSGNNSTKLAERFARLMVRKAMSRAEVENTVKTIYYRRNDILHGDDQTHFDNPLESISSMPWLRSVCREAIILTYLALLDSQLHDSPIAEHCRCISRSVPRNRNDLMTLVYDDGASSSAKGVAWEVINKSIVSSAVRIGINLDSVFEELPCQR